MKSSYHSYHYDGWANGPAPIKKNLVPQERHKKHRCAVKLGQGLLD